MAVEWWIAQAYGSKARQVVSLDGSKVGLVDRAGLVYVQEFLSGMGYTLVRQIDISPGSDDAVMETE